MSATIIDCVQGSPEWAAARLGLPTASMFKALLANSEERKMRSKYMRQLAGEIITGEPMETYSNGHMERGNAKEDEARRAYAFMADTEPELVGFIRNGNKGCSPDSLIGDRGMLEIKTALPDILIEKIVKAEFPPEHIAQCQGNLLCAEREWIDIAIYSPKMPLFRKRATRDAPYLAKLTSAIDAFNEELQELVEKIRRYA